MLNFNCHSYGAYRHVKAQVSTENLKVHAKEDHVRGIYTSNQSFAINRRYAEE